MKWKLLFRVYGLGYSPFQDPKPRDRPLLDRGASKRRPALPSQAILGLGSRVLGFLEYMGVSQN